MSRSNRKRVAIVLVTIVLVVATAWWCSPSPDPTPTARVAQMHVVDADTVVVLWFSGARGWVSRVDASGRTRWWRELPDAPLTGDALHVAGSVVAVRYTHRTESAPFGVDQSLVAFSLENGMQLWDQVLTPYYPIAIEGHGTAEPELETYVSWAYVNGRLVEWATAASESIVIGIDPTAGTQVWRQNWEEDRFSPDDRDPCHPARDEGDTLARRHGRSSIVSRHDGHRMHCRR